MLGFISEKDSPVGLKTYFRIIQIGSQQSNMGLDDRQHPLKDTIPKKDYLRKWCIFSFDSKFQRKGLHKFGFLTCQLPQSIYRFPSKFAAKKIYINNTSIFFIASNLAPFVLITFLVKSGSRFIFDSYQQDNSIQVGKACGFKFLDLAIFEGRQLIFY